MVVGKLVLRDFAGSHGPKGNFTVLYDGDGELDFRLAKYHIFYHGKGIKILCFRHLRNTSMHIILYANKTEREINVIKFPLMSL